jgi:uncharacterized protein DUF6152
MRTRLIVILTGVGLLLAVGPVLAHHAFAGEFDVNRPLKFAGTVTKMEWINPHAWIHVDVKQPDGTIASWMCEAGTPNTLFRRGFTKESLAVGTEIIVDGYQAKDGTHRMNGRNVTLPDGKTLFLGSAGTGAPPDGKDPSEKR